MPLVIGKAWYNSSDLFVLVFPCWGAIINCISILIKFA